MKKKKTAVSHWKKKYDVINLNIVNSKEIIYSIYCAF